MSCSKEEYVTPILDQPVSMIVIDGNSLSIGQGSTTGGYAKLFRDSGYTVYVRGIGGQSLTQMINNCQDVDTTITKNALLIVDEITNELYFGSSPDTTFERLKRYCQQRKQLHPSLRIVIVTPTPRSNPGTPIDFETKRQAVIAKIKADKKFYNYLANAGEDSLIGYNGAQFDTQLYYDSVHHTDSGYNRRGLIIWNSSNLKKIGL